MRALAPLVLSLIALLVTVAPPRAAASDGYNLTGVEVFEEGTWSPENRFGVYWDRNEPRDTMSVAHWEVRGPNHEPIPGADSGVDVENWGAASPEVPAPGLYWFKVWNETATGPGPPVWVPLRFDDAPPPPVAISAPAWVAAGTRVPIRIVPPAKPLPVSGIDGYAVSVDGSPSGSSPCAAGYRCRPAELDLSGGIDVRTISLPAQPEGIRYVHAVAVSGSGMSSAPVATRAIGVDGTPPAVRLEDAPAGWASGPVRLTAVATDPLSGMDAAGPGGPVTAIEVDDRRPLLRRGDAAGAIVAGEGSHRVVYWGRDAVGNAGDGSLPFAPAATATVRIDETAPTVRFLARDAGDPERLEAAVADRLSGPAPDRGEIGIRPLGSPGRFLPLPTVVRQGRLVARWNSDDFPRGAYEFRARGYDAAGNSAASTVGPDGAPLVLHDPVKREARLAFGFGAARLVYQRCARAHGRRRCHRTVVRSFARRPPNRTVPCCRGTLVGGRLLDAAGTPLPGHPVDVVETFARGARHRARTTAVTTDGDGRFRLRLAPGPSRTVSAAFPGTHRLTRAAGRRLRLRVRAAVRLRASSARARVGGAPVVFSGRVLHRGARIPPTGLSVELEFRLPGMAWAEFRTLRTDAAGRFRFPYSFSDDDSAGVRFLFRAFVPATGGWAFAPASSRPLAVTG